jgi:two-component system, NarL family, nitrate/nitrite response regulator NarL
VVPQPRISVLLIYPNRLLREALRQLLMGADFDIVEEASSASDALPRLMAQLQTDLVLVDFGDSREAFEGPFARRWQGIGKLVALVDASALAGIRREQIDALNGLVTYDVTSEMLFQSLRRIQAGERIFPRSLLDMVTSRDETEPRGAESQELSPREADVLRHLARGSSNKSIAGALRIAEATVKVHLKAVLRKIGVPNRTKAALWAERVGFERRIARAEQDVKQAEERVAEQQSLLARIEKAGDSEALEHGKEVLEDFYHGLQRAQHELKLKHSVRRLRL